MEIWRFFIDLILRALFSLVFYTDLYQEMKGHGETWRLMPMFASMDVKSGMPGSRVPDDQQQALNVNYNVYTSEGRAKHLQSGKRY